MTAYALGMALILLAPGTAGADGVVDIFANPTTTGPYLFPNWTQTLVSSFSVEIQPDAVDPCTGPLTGLTIVNIGAPGTVATNADLTGVWYRLVCPGGFDTGLVAMTYAGAYVQDGGTLPAWTWGGVVSPWADACSKCGCFPTLEVYVTVAACPTDGRTVQMGPGINSTLNPGWPGGYYDQCGYAAPWAQTTDPLQRFIKFTAKEGRPDFAAPADTVTYTIYYGRPGTNANLAVITVFDTLPPYTHYVPGSGVPAPDAGWDPDPGPPLHLQWTIPGPLPTANGPSGQVTFQLTVDWGNGESFEPGSGDVAAPEGARLGNVAAATFSGAGGTCLPTYLSNPVQTVVRRFLFWKVPDNDVLFTNSYGQPPDEVTYSIFLKNMSSSKTWWNVSIWDSVPVDINPFCTNCGFDDPCLGWTMTPSGCSAASPSWAATGPPATTQLRWSLDMPPDYTIEVRWKGQVKGTALDGTTAVSAASVLAYGRSRVLNGTGSSVAVKQFMNQIPYVLPTTYISYIGIAAANANFWSCSAIAPGGNSYTYWLSFFPLNKKADFNLYEQNHAGDAYYTSGGASPTINAFAGGCMTGGANWIPGCKVERAPAHYLPAVAAGCPGLTAFHNLYKLVSNSPLLWELLSGDLKQDADASTYAGCTSLTYSGFTSYTFCRVNTFPVTTDGLYIMNTSPATATTVHLFLWDQPSLSYQYLQSADLNNESQWFFNPQGTSQSVKGISSDAPLIIFKAYPGIGQGGAFNDEGSQAPNKENGYLVSNAGNGTFYAVCGGPANDGTSLSVGNVSGGGTYPAVLAKYEVWEYFSDTPTLPNPTASHLTTQLLGSSGNWTRMTTDTVPAGQTAALNPHVYGAGYDTLIQDQYTWYKVKLLAGGPIQVYNGRDEFSGYGCGSVIHAVTPPNLVSEYWFQQSDAGNACGGNNYDIQVLDAYCPKANTTVTLTSGSNGTIGTVASYVTPGQDSCVTFKALTTPTAPGRINYEIVSTGGQIAVMHQIHCQLTEKIYTAPFLHQGVHYTIIAPPVAYVGQTFWITVQVVQTNGSLVTDYCGTSSFTSTDPAARLEGSAMDAYNYTWTTNAGGACAACSSGCDNGTRLFFKVTLSLLGLQTIVAVDTLDGSITGLTTVNVVGADVKLTKSPPLQVSASGDVVQFKICWSNYSTATASGFTITDAVPDGTVYLPDTPSNHLCGATFGFGAATVAYSTAATPTGFQPMGGVVTQPPNVTYLRWTIPTVGVMTTGCVCFKVTVQ